MRSTIRSAVLLFLICVVTAPLPAAENVATLRFSSLDTVLADVERISAATGEAKSRDQLLRDSFGPLGLGDGAWIDGKLPIVISLPANGMMNMGWVGALPVKNSAEALAGLETRLGTPEVDGDLRAFVSTMGATIQVRPVENYLLFGQTATAVRGADLQQLLEAEALPPGNVVLDLDLVPLTTMAQFGMAAGRQAVAENLGLDESDTEGREMAMSMYDFYVGVLNDILLNARRLQLSFEIGSEEMRIHEWLLPRANSTLAGLLKAQKSGFPDLARRLNVEAAVAVMAGSIDFTQEIRSAVEDFAKEYTKLIPGMAQSMTVEERERYLSFMGPWTVMADRWIGCTRGDGVVSYDFGAESGFRVTQLAGLTDIDGCGDLVTDLAKAIAEVPASPEGRPFVVVQENAFVHSGVQATRVDVDMFGGMAETDEQSTEFLEQMFGGENYVSYMGVRDDLLISSAGAASEQAFKDAVDKLSVKKKRGGMTPKQFEPLKAGSGLYMALDAKRLLHELAKLDPEDEDLQELGALADQAGRWVFGTHLNRDALRFELSMPLSALEVFAALDDDDDDDGQEHEEDDDPQDSGHS